MIAYAVWLMWIHNIRVCWGGPGVPVPTDISPRCCCYDLDQDGDVDLHDLSLMLQATEERVCGE